jgi:hypothetical protein
LGTSSVVAALVTIEATMHGALVAITHAVVFVSGTFTGTLRTVANVFFTVVGIAVCASNVQTHVLERYVVDGSIARRCLINGPKRIAGIKTGRSFNKNLVITGMESFLAD